MLRAVAFLSERGHGGIVWSYGYGLFLDMIDAHCYLAGVNNDEDEEYVDDYE